MSRGYLLSGSGLYECLDSFEMLELFRRRCQEWILGLAKEVGSSLVLKALNCSPHTQFVVGTFRSSLGASRLASLCRGIIVLYVRRRYVLVLLLAVSRDTFSIAMSSFDSCRRSLVLSREQPRRFFDVDRRHGLPSTAQSLLHLLDPVTQSLVLFFCVPDLPVPACQLAICADVRVQVAEELVGEERGVGGVEGGEDEGGGCRTYAGKLGEAREAGAGGVGRVGGEGGGGDFFDGGVAVGGDELEEVGAEGAVFPVRWSVSVDEQSGYGGWGCCGRGGLQLPFDER